MQYKYKAILTPLFAAAAILIAAAFSHPVRAQDGWTNLLEGDSLGAWRGYKSDDVPESWKLDDGVLTRTGQSGDLITKDEFGDFELRFDWKIAEGGNSGVLYRLDESEPEAYMTGPEYQVLDNPAHNLKATDESAAGSLYALYSAEVDAAKPAGEWNTGRIVVDNGKIEHWLNGEKLFTAELGSDDWNQRVAASKFAEWKNFGKLAQGHIGFQDHGAQVWYRNVRVRKLDDSRTASDKPVRILYVTQSEGFRHSAVARDGDKLAPSEQVMKQLAAENDFFTVDFTQDVAKDFTKDNLANYDLVMFYTTGNLPIPGETLEYFLNDWLKEKGHGFLGVHAAADTYHEYEPYWDMIGGTFDGHPWGAGSTVTISVQDPDHPASAPWGKEFTIQDEIYQFKHWQPEKVHVLMSLNMAKTELKKPYHVPVLWVKDYGDGRVMHMSLGHREDVWTNPTYQKSLLGGIRWLAGLEQGDAAPNPEVSAQEEEKAKRAANNEAS